MKPRQITRQELLDMLSKFEIKQRIDGDLVDGIINPVKHYIRQPGYRNYEEAMF